MITKLYLISATNNEGENQDLFISARDDLEAVKLWRETVLGFCDTLAEEVCITEVPTVSETPRAHMWHAEMPVRLTLTEEA